LPIRAIEHVKETIPIRPHHQLARCAVPLRIDKDGNLNGVVIVGIVRGELKMPLELPGIRIERYDRIRIQVVARALCGIPIGTGISSTQ
jgi:hypothetical protein